MSGRLKIAVADDEADTSEYLLEYLALLGHEVRAAAAGDELVELCRQFHPDLVVTDYAMPGATGLAAATAINRERSVPVILLSGRHDVEARIALDSHVIRFLAKPVRTADLRAAIEAVAAGATALRVGMDGDT